VEALKGAYGVKQRRDGEQGGWVCLCSFDELIQEEFFGAYKLRVNYIFYDGQISNVFFFTIQAHFSGSRFRTAQITRRK
jgi:hypothetical protein